MFIIWFRSLGLWRIIKNVCLWLCCWSHQLVSSSHWEWCSQLLLSLWNRRSRPDLWVLLNKQSIYETYNFLGFLFNQCTVYISMDFRCQGDVALTAYVTFRDAYALDMAVLLSVSPYLFPIGIQSSYQALIFTFSGSYDRWSNRFDINVRRLLTRI